MTRKARKDACFSTSSHTAATPATRTERTFRACCGLYHHRHHHHHHHQSRSSPRRPLCAKQKKAGVRVVVQALRHSPLHPLYVCVCVCVRACCVEWRVHSNLYRDRTGRRAGSVPGNEVNSSVPRHYSAMVASHDMHMHMHTVCSLCRVGEPCTDEAHAGYHGTTQRWNPPPQHTTHPGGRQDNWLRTRRWTSGTGQASEGTPQRRWIASQSVESACPSSV